MTNTSSTSTKASEAAKVDSSPEQRAEAIAKAGRGRGVKAPTMAQLKAGECIVVAGLPAALAQSVARIEQRAAMAEAAEGRNLTTPNADAYQAKAHKATKGRAGIGGRADSDTMRAFIAEFIADEDNAGRGGKFSATKASRAYQATHQGQGSWPMFRGLFAEAIADSVKGGRSAEAKATKRAATIEAAKGKAMMAGIGYGKAEAGDFTARLLTWCEANDTKAAEALREVAAEAEAAKAQRIEAAKAAAKAKAAEARKAAKATTTKGGKGKATTKAGTKAPTKRTTKAPAKVEAAEVEAPAEVTA